MQASVTAGRRQKKGRKKMRGGSELISKVLMVERLPRRFNIVEHQ